jgi:hypothetical protein
MNGQVRSIDVLFDPTRLAVRVRSWVRKASFTSPGVMVPRYFPLKTSLHTAAIFCA